MKRRGRVGGLGMGGNERRDEGEGEGETYGAM